MSVIPVLERWRKEDKAFRASLGYMVNSRSVWALSNNNNRFGQTLNSVTNTGSSDHSNPRNFLK